MSIKFDLDLNLDGIVEELEDQVEASVQSAMSKGFARARSHAMDKLADKPFQFFDRGFRIESIDPLTFVVILEGDMANLFDEGKTSRLPSKIMSGQVARENSQEGKDYVDVPFFKDADMAGNVKVGKDAYFNVKAFQSADEVIQSFKKATPKGRTPMQARIKKAKTILEDKGTKSVYQTQKKNKRYLTFQRVTNSTQWNDMKVHPALYDQNAKILSDFIIEEFDKAIKEV